MAKWFHIKDDLFTCVDDRDWKRFSDKMWSLGKGGYAATKNSEGPNFLLHRLVVMAKDGTHVDHINGCRLDNRLSNLRAGTRTQNMHNIERKGVHFSQRDQKWTAKCSGKWLGAFNTEAEAREAYKAASLVRSEESFFNRPSEPVPTPTAEEREEAIQHRIKVAQASEMDRIAKSNSVLGVGVKNNLGESFATVSEAARKYNLNVAHISACCRGKRQTCGKMTWIYSG